MASSPDHERCIAVMAKQPRPGQVKTRLAADLGDAAASELCAAFLRDTLDHLPPAAESTLVFFHSPADAGPYFAQLEPHAVLLAQPSIPFGERLRFGFQQLFEAGHGRVLFIGCDTPHLTRATLRNAFETLDSHDLVLGPCDDGGYYLIGLKAPAPQLFDQIPWSTPQVMELTRKRAKALGLVQHELPRSFDVDDISDLHRLQELLASDPGLCPATGAQLDLLG